MTVTGTATGGNMYSRGFQHILEGIEEDEESMEESGNMPEKKRRLSVEQVKALEKNFEVENKLEPERKVKLAQELGLLPRQVAVWFQNRRARWKTKQLEKDFRVLKANYESLQISCNTLQHDKEALMAEMRELKAKYKEEISCSTGAVVKEEMTQETEEAANFVDCKSLSLNEDLDNNSDSSAILDDSIDPSSKGNGSLNPIMAVMISPSSASSSIDCYDFSDMRVSGGTQQFLKMEEHNFLNVGEETCNFFSDEQAPSLPWYCTEPWN